MTFYEKCKAKYALIAEVLLEINDLPLHNKKLYLHDFSKEPLPDNPFFMSYLRYRKNQSTMSRLLEEHYHGNLKAMIQGLINK